MFEGNLELAATRDVTNGTITTKAGIQYRQNLGGTTEAVTLPGQALAVPVNTDGTIIGYVGLDAKYDLSAASTLNLSAKAAVGGNQYLALSASLGVKTKF